MESRSAKIRAALVIIAWVAVVASLWGMENAGRRAMAGTLCEPGQLRGKALRLEMAGSPDEVREILQGTPVRPAAVRRLVRLGRAVSPGEALGALKREEAACIHKGLDAVLVADFRLIPSYSALTVGLFLFVLFLRQEKSRRRHAVLALGALLALAMFLGDLGENVQLRAVLDLAARSAPDELIRERLAPLALAGAVKWGALALSSAVLGLLWTSGSRRLKRVPQGLGLAAAAALALGLIQVRLGAVAGLEPWQTMSGGIALLGAFWLAALVHAVAVAVQPEPVDLSLAPPRPAAPQPLQAPPPDPGSPTYAGVYPESLRDRELTLVEERRRQVGLRSVDRLVGFGLSGGGIRSATFCLGLFQGLARRRLLSQIDFLSTVSGGGYFGSFFGRLLSRHYVRKPEDVEDVLLGRKYPKVLEFLRENGRYLSPNGAGDTLLFTADLLRNWFSIQLVLATFVVALFLVLQSVRVAGEHLGGSVLGLSPLPMGGSVWWSPFLALPLAAFALWAFPAGWAYWLVEPESQAIREGADRGKAKRESSAISPFTGVALVLIGCIWVTGATWGRPIAWLWAALGTAAVMTLLFWKLARKGLSGMPSPAGKMDRELYRSHEIRSRLGMWLTQALVVSALLLGLALIDSLGQTTYAALKSDGSFGAWLAGTLSSLGILAGFARRIAAFFSRGPRRDRPSAPLKWVATLAALLLVGLLLVSLNTLSHAVAWGMEVPGHAPARLLSPPPAEDGESAYAVDVREGSGQALSLRISRERPEAAPARPAGRGARNPWPVTFGLTVTVLLSILFGQTWPFVNRSSHQPIYGSRLTRAYLGASNERRWNDHNVTEPVEGDDYDLARYWPPPASNGAPIHLINVTINETIDGRSQVQQQDRKGLGLALGPWGMSAGSRHHVVMPLGDENRMQSPKGKPIKEIHPQEPDAFRVFDYPVEQGAPIFTGEMLPLGSWLSISGAAFSTGTGMRTSLGLSLLAGLGNVRLGQWWDSGILRKAASGERKLSLRLEDLAARIFPVQTYLLDEFTARFPGTSRRHWYLSDGGHFENMGGYELIRRRLRLIVIVDAEMDAKATFEGLANLVRKARLDFGAEITFLDEGQLDAVVNRDVRRYVGALEQLRRGKWDIPEGGSGTEGPRGSLAEADAAGRSLAHAALARVDYDTEPKRSSWLLYVKPTLTGDEPADLLEYHSSHPDFPHEPTLDQYFDEAQWESYRRLGDHIAEKLFGALGELVPDDDRAENANLLNDWDWREVGLPPASKRGDRPSPG